MNHGEISRISDVFSIAPELASRFPSLTVGVAIIRDVVIQKQNTDLWDRLSAQAREYESLTPEAITNYPEISSYRRLYKETGVDLHDRRPSPEALLRRIAKGKGLYQINTCVDAYNLVVLKNRISSGAFDLDKVAFPTVLRFAREGEEILLLGDKESTPYHAGEIAYFDQVGGYNIDLNYRDAQRTAVTLETRNLLINIEGVYEIPRSALEEALQETVAEITAYCGGVLEMIGMVAA